MDISPRSKVERAISRKLPNIGEIARNESSKDSDGFEKESKETDTLNKLGSDNAVSKMKESPGSLVSVAYISETLIIQITKEQNVDLIQSLTIHLPKDKLNKKIKFIENLEKLKRLQSLNLSNNVIEKMQKMETLVELRELNLANNCIKVIEGIEHMVKLQVLNLSGNQITSLPGPTMKKLRCLKVIKLSHNKLDSLLDITRLRTLQDLTNLDLQGNPFTSLPHYRLFVIFQLRSVDVLDNQAVTAEERLQADQRFAQDEIHRLELELTKQEKLYQHLQNEKKEANTTVDQLTAAQNTMKINQSKLADRIKELEQEIGAQDNLLKAKNLDLIKASENQYRLEQELAFYKLDAKFEVLGEMPVVDDIQLHEQQSLEDSAYIGKATFKANKFIRQSNISAPQEVAHWESLRRKYEEDRKISEELDRELQEKREAIMQMRDHLARLARDIDAKNDELQTTSEKLASLELALAGQMSTLGQGNELVRKQLAEKIAFIKRLQEAAQELERRMQIVASDQAEKQNELEELERNAAEHNTSNGDLQKQLGLSQALKSKQDELQDSYAQLSKMKEELQMLKTRIAEEESEAELLRRQVGRDLSVSQKAIEQLKEELEGVIDGLNERMEELQNTSSEQQAMIKSLEKERDVLKTKLAKQKKMEGDMDTLERQLSDAIQALEEERRECQDLEAKEKDLRDRLAASDKNNKLGQIETEAKQRHAEEENGKLKDIIKKLKRQIEDERKTAKDRVQRDQERIAKALQAAREAGDKDKEMKGLALQVNALKATNEALNDRLEEAENELKNKEQDSINKDLLLKRLNELLNDLEKGRQDIKQPLDESDGIGHCLADLHKKYLELVDELGNEKEKGKGLQKQAKAVIDKLKADLAQVKSQLNAAEKALAQLSQEETQRDADRKNLEDDVYRLQDNLRAALDKAEAEANKRVKEKDGYEEMIKAMKEKIKRLQDELKDKRNQASNELKQLRELVAKQKDSVENEIKELQNELKDIRHKHWKELREKDDEIAELEVLLEENANIVMGERNKADDELQTELKRLRRLVSDQTKAAQVARNQETEMRRAHQELEEARRKIERDLDNVQSKFHDVERIFNAKVQRGFEHDHAVTALTREIDKLKTAMDEQEHDLTKVLHTTKGEKKSGEIPSTETHHHIYSHTTPVNNGHETIHYHHHENSLPVAKGTIEHTIVRTPDEVTSSGVVGSVHHHHHYGDGDFTVDLKKKKRTRKIDYCNVSEHEDLEGEVIQLEDRLASANRDLSSQRTENKLDTLRSDLHDLQRTVSESCRTRSISKSLETHLDETLAKFQDHLLTLMDHRTNLLS